MKRLLHRMKAVLPAFLILAGLLSLTVPATTSAQALRENDPDLQNIDVAEQLGSLIPLDVPLVDENGQPVILKDYFKKDRPVILTLGYYRCPMLCNLVMNGVRDAIVDNDLKMGTDFQIVTVSINPEETPELATAKKQNYMESMQHPADDPGWRFLTGPAESSTRLADAVGFKYYYDEDRKEYAHPAVVMLLSPEGKITRYLYGIQIEPRDMKLAVMEASNGKVGSTIDKLILYCYHYDPTAKGYVAMASKIMMFAGFGMVLIMGTVVTGLWRWEKRRGGSNRWASYTHRPYMKEKSE